MGSLLPQLLWWPAQHPERASGHGGEVWDEETARGKGEPGISQDAAASRPRPSRLVWGSRSPARLDAALLGRASAGRGPRELPMYTGGLTAPDTRRFSPQMAFWSKYSR